MIYLDASVALADMLGENRRPSNGFWEQSLVSSRLLEYELWTRVHAYGLSVSHADRVRELVERLAFVELTPTVLERAREPFPDGIRTLDAMHLASATWLQTHRQPIRLATYDKRLLSAAKSLNIPAFEPD